MSTGPIQLTRYDAGFDTGPYVAGIVVLSVAFVLLFAAFAVLLVLNEGYSRKVDAGELNDASNIASVRRQRGGSSGDDDDDEEGDEEDEEEEEDDGAAKP